MHIASVLQLNVHIIYIVKHPKSDGAQALACPEDTQ